MTLDTYRQDMSVQTKEVYQSIKELEAEITALKKEVSVKHKARTAAGSNFVDIRPGRDLEI